MAVLTQTIGKTEYTATIEDASLLLGGKDIDGLIPNTNLSKWEDEAFINLNPKWFAVYENGLYSKSITSDYTNGLLSLTKGDVKWQTYIDLNDQLSTEFVFADLSALSNFTNNQLSLDILKSDEIAAHHQPALTADEIKGGSFRPDDVVNSYAFYFNKKNNKYKTGKFAHLYASYFIDDDGNRIKLEQTIDGNQLIISWAKVLDWLSTAKLPVTLDPLIGPQICAASTQSINDYFYGSPITMGATVGTGGSIFGCFSGWQATEKIKLAMYLDSDNSLVANSETEEKSTGSAHGVFTEFTFPSAPNLTASVDYILTAWADSPLNLRYDSVSTKRLSRSLAYGAWPELHGGGESTQNFLASLYLDYTESGGGLSIPIAQRVIMF